MPPTRSRLLLATFLSLFAVVPATASAAPELHLDEVLKTGSALNDGIFGPGDQIDIRPSFTVGEADFDGGNGSLAASAGSKTTTPTYFQPIPAAARHEGTYPANPYTIKLGSDYVCGTPTPLLLTISGANGTGAFPITIPTGVAGPHQNFVSDDIGDTVSDSETVESDVAVSSTGKVKSIRVHLDSITHTYSIRWYEISLVSPKGTRVKLFSRFGEDTQKSFENVTFSDSAAMEYTDQSITQYKDLTVRPYDSLSAFDGEDAAGKWRLEVRDIHEAGAARSNRGVTRSSDAGRAAGRSATGEVVGQVNGWSMDAATAVCDRTPIASISPLPLVLDPYGGTVVSGAESVDPGKRNNGTADGAIAKYEWDFDNIPGYELDRGVNTTATSPVIPKGKRTVRLKVTDNDGNVNEATTDAIVSKVPVISAVTATPSSPEAGQLTTLFAAAADADGSIASYLWDFDGDGIFEVNGSASSSTTYTWNKSGPQVVRVKVIDNDGAAKVKAFTVSVANKPPVAKLKIDASPVIMGQDVALNASESSDPDGEIVQYDWDADGDGIFEVTGKTSKTLTYKYDEAGPQTVTVRVQDNSGLTATASQSFTVTAPPTAVIQTSGNSIRPGGSVTFDGRSSTPGDIGGSISKYEWDLDGNNSYEATGSVVSKAYPNVSNVQVKLRVTNANLATGGTNTMVVIANPGGGGAVVPTPVPTPAPTPAPGGGSTTPPAVGEVPKITNPAIVTTPGLSPDAPVTQTSALNVAEVFGSEGTPEAAGVLPSGFQAKLTVASKQKVKKSLKSGIAVKVTANAPGTIVVKGMFAAKLAKSLGLKPKKNAPLAVASGKLVIKKAGTYKFVVKVPKKYQRYVKKSKKSLLTLRAAVTEKGSGDILAIGKNVTLVKG